MAHNYGLNENVRMYTPYSGKPIRIERPYKKVMLVNVGDCKDRITIWHVCHRLQGIGWFEWEDLLAHWLVQAVVDAVQEGKEEADISQLFTCDLRGDDYMGEFVKSQEKVIDFLMGRLFECIYDDGDVMQVRITEKSICQVQV